MHVAICIIQCRRLYSYIQYKLYSVQCTLYIILCTYKYKRVCICIVLYMTYTVKSHTHTHTVHGIYLYTFIYIVHCTLYIVQFIVYTVHYTQCKLYIVQCTVYAMVNMNIIDINNVNSLLFHSECYCIICIFYEAVQYTLYTVQCTQYIVHCIMNSIVYIKCVQYICGIHSLV